MSSLQVRLYKQMSQDIIEKNYYQSLMAGHYFDVRVGDSEWKLAKIVDRDKRYAVVIYDGVNSREEQVMLHSWKTAPLRSNTQGYTGQTYKAYRSNLTPVSEYKAHLEILQQTYLKEQIPNAFTITQYLRGELFVLVHALLARDDLKEEEGTQAMQFLIGFIEFAVKLSERVKKILPEYFEAINNNKYLYLINEKVALVQSLSEMIALLNWILKIECPKVICFHRSKFINSDLLMKFFNDMGKTQVFIDLFNANDGNSKWLSFSTHKQLYFLLKKISAKFSLPSYKLKDYQEAIQIYTFVIKQQEKDNKVQEKYVRFLIQLIKTQATFEAKLKALQELRKILQEETKIYQINEKVIYNIIHDEQIIDLMTSQYNFNPEIFKRLLPILPEYCKYKPISPKNIMQLFKIASNRHESEVVIIHEIICFFSEVVAVQSLDTIYAQILKGSLNNQQTLKFIKNFTIKAVYNYSRQKSFILSFFKKTKNSSKYGYYGLDLFLKQMQDDGQLNKQNTLLCIEMMSEFFSKDCFEKEKQKYISHCVSWLGKKKHFAQAIKTIDRIISTYPQNTFFEDSRKGILQKLIKEELLEKIIFGLQAKLSQAKFTKTEIIKSAYDFLQENYDTIVSHIKINHIEFLWKLGQTKLLADFLKKNRGEGKKKYNKKLDENIQQQILTVVIRKQSFFTRPLIIEQFQALNEIFISYNLLKKKIDITERGFVRYLTPEMEGYNFYFEFLEKMSQSPHINKIIKRTINVFLRPKDEKDYDIKINTWKMCLLKMVDKLKNSPEVCLNAIQIFFDLIQGSTVRDNINVQGSVQIVVSHDGNQKMIILPKNSTIWKLRKQVMSQYNIQGDFILYNNNMRREISFIQEQEFSLNALPLEFKGPSILVMGRKKEKHPQIIAYQKFKQMIEKQQLFYQKLFSLNNEKNQQLFWKTVDLLPVNRSLVKKIQNCVSFKKKNWQSILKVSTTESLQYHLNIIFELMQRNKKWVSLFESSQGLHIILQCLSDQKGQLLQERIVNRCLLIIIKVLQIVDKIDHKLLQEIFLTLMAKLIYTFKDDKPVYMSLQTVNFTFNLLNKLLEDIKSTPLQLQIIFKIISFGVFQPKNKGTTDFIQNNFEPYLINNYKNQQQKKSIFKYTLSLLQLQNLVMKQHSEMLFVFFIDYMNTFFETQNSFITQEGYLTQIQAFVMQCFNSQIADATKTKMSSVLFGSLKLFIYTLGFPQNTFDLSQIFSILINQFLLNKKQKRIKHQTTTKLVYQALKKILFTKPSLIDSLCSIIVPQLSQAKWRKNLLSSWMIQSKRQQRSTFGGLQNLGATCYINCLIQQLFHIQHFRQHFLSIESSTYKPNLDQNEIYQLQHIFSSLKFSIRKSITTKKFCESFITYEGVPINPMVQSDADEFFNALMQKIQSFLKFNKRHDIIQNTFEGTLSNQLNCQGCPHKSEKQQHFLSIGLNIRGKKCLQEALQGFVEGQILDGDNAYYCEPCEKKVKTLKRLCIKQLPNILIIVLKRFQFNYDQMKKIKINSYLKFPEVLDMQKYTADYLAGDQSGAQEDFSYSLRGTVIHSGTSQGGHYYSFAKPNDKWYSFNDEFIDQINSKKIEEEGFGGQDKNTQSQFKFQKYKNAYILFYEKIKTSSSYHRSEQQILNSYTEQIKSQIKQQNNNTQFLSVILDGNFVRLVQNLSCLDGIQSFKFTMLYFHTVVLRDKNKEQHIPNYYRIICSLLKDKKTSQWYLSQINHRFIKEFMIQAPRMVRFISTSLVINAIKMAETVPENIFSHGVFCLKKNGMTPFAKIFKELSKTQAYRHRLEQLQYPQRVISIVLDKPEANFAMNEVQSFDSYFGTDCSEKEKDKQTCFASLCESLENFTIAFEEVFQIFSKTYSRGGSKALISMLCKDLNIQQLKVILASLQSDIVKQGQMKREDIEKYMLFIRANCLNKEDQSQKITACINSLKKIINQCKSYYDPMDTIIREVNYVLNQLCQIGCRNIDFCVKLRESLSEKIGLVDLTKALRYWLKDADHPLNFGKSEDIKRRTIHMNFQEKSRFYSMNKYHLQNRMGWILDKENEVKQQIFSDMEDEETNRQLNIRNKRFKVKQHLGLLKRVEIDGQEKWGILEKSELDLYSNL